MRCTVALCLALAAIGPLYAQSTSQAVTARAGDVRVETFFTKALGIRKHYLIYLPPTYRRDSHRRFPVAIYLHGASGNERDWIASGGLDHVMDSLVTQGRPEFIVVMPDGDDGWYTDAVAPASYQQCAAQHTSKEPAADYCVHRARYAEYIWHDLVAHMDATYRTLADRRHRAIGGLSMGGYGAVTLALAHPDVFSAAVSHSGAFSLLLLGPHPFAPPGVRAASTDTIRALYGWLYPALTAAFGTDTASWWARDPAAIGERVQKTGAVMPALFLDVGSDDGLVIDRNRFLHWRLTRLGIPHEYRELPGTHDWRFWRAHLGDGLAWLGARIGN